MFDKKKGLEYLLRIAQNKGISQSKLCENIYDVSHFNRMCNGKEQISIEVLLLCADKLNIEYQDLFAHAVLDQDRKTYDYINEFKRLSQMNGYFELTKLYQDVIMIEDRSSQLQQLVLILEAYLQWRCHNDGYHAQMLLQQAFQTTAGKFDLIHGDYQTLTEMELDVLNDLAICYHKKGKSKKAIALLEHIVLNMDVTHKIDAWLKYVTNLSEICMRIHNLTKACKYSTIGIERSLKTNNYLYLCQLYYILAIIQFQLHKIDAFQKELHKSFVLAVSQNRKESFLLTLEQDHGTYGIQESYIHLYKNYGDFANAQIQIHK